jgi:hypothetical protein
MLQNLDPEQGISNWEKESEIEREREKLKDRERDRLGKVQTWN